jgi:4-hydroxybenzoate polyprenyltransferase
MTGIHDSRPPSPADALLAWRQLLRLGNVFTAASNVIAGFLIVQASWAPFDVPAALIAASACLYAAGMVLNDAFDADLDARERPERPIPSGRIQRSTAFLVGWVLLAFGVFFAFLAVWLTGRVGPAVVALCLALMIVMYDGGLKSTWASPWAMGWCRALNVLLGGALASGASVWIALGTYAVAVGLYTAGLTMIASREAGQPPLPYARWGKEVMAVACGLLFAWPWTLVGDSTRGAGPVAATIGFTLFAVYVAVHMLRAARAHEPGVIRGAVKRLLLGFVLIDACAALAAAGWASGLAVLLLLAPTLAGARRAPMT